MYWYTRERRGTSACSVAVAKRIQILSRAMQPITRHMQPENVAHLARSAHNPTAEPCALPHCPHLTWLQLELGGVKYV